MQEMSSGMKVAVGIFIASFLYLFAVTFVPMFAPLPEAGEEQSKTIVPYLLGIISTLVGFYYGKKHERENPTISPIDEAAIVAAKTEAKKAVDSTAEKGELV